MKKYLILFLVAVLSIIVIVTGCSSSPAPAPSPSASNPAAPAATPSQTPRAKVKLEVMGPQAAVTGGTVAAALADILNKKLSWMSAGTTESIASTQDIVESVKKDPNSWIMIVAMPSFYEARAGVKPYDKKYDHIRLIANTIEPSIVTFASLNPKITTWKDLSGKKMASNLLTSSTARMLDEVLKAWGIYESVNISRMEWGACYEAVKDGLVDFTFITAGSPPVWGGGALPDQFVSEKSAQIQWISIDKETIDKVKKNTGFPYSYIEMPPGSKKNQTQLVTGMGFPPVMVGCDAKADPELMYQITKTIYDNYQLLGNYYPPMKTLTQEKMLATLGVGTDEGLYNPGTLKYLKESGLWQKTFAAK
jgi:uncharacterized protein